MWISKKKYEAEISKSKTDTFIEGMDAHDEREQWERIVKLEKQVKKLKKQIREGY
jgi:hypothetical protein